MVNHWHSLIWCHVAVRLLSTFFFHSNFFFILYSVKDSATFRIVNTGSRMPRIMSTFTTWWPGYFHHQPDSHQSMNNMVTLFDAWLGHTPSVNPSVPSHDWASKISRLVNQPSSLFDKRAYITTHRSMLSHQQLATTTTTTSSTTTTITLVEHQSLFNQSINSLSINTLHLVQLHSFAHPALNFALTSQQFVHMDLIAYSRSIGIHYIRIESQYDTFWLGFDDLAILTLRIWMTLFTMGKNVISVTGISVCSFWFVSFVA